MLYYNESSTRLLNHVIKGSLFIVTFNNLFVVSIKIKNVYIWLLFNKGLLENDVTESTVFVTYSNHWFFFSETSTALNAGLLSFSKIWTFFFWHKHNWIGHKFQNSLRHPPGFHCIYVASDTILWMNYRYILLWLYAL